MGQTERGTDLSIHLQAGYVRGCLRVGNITSESYFPKVAVRAAGEKAERGRERVHKTVGNPGPLWYRVACGGTRLMPGRRGPCWHMSGKQKQLGLKHQKY